MPSEKPSAPNPLADPALRQSLTDFVRRRVPASDVDDVVQTVLVDALAAEGRPGDPAELRRWILGIARHKVVDLHRRAHREPPAELPDVEASPAPIEARELVRWAEEQAGSSRDAKQTLDWMAREGEGEKLESIAASEQVPAARVRQRVSRMRRWMKERWVAELAAAAVLVALAIIAWKILRKPNEDLPEARPDKPRPSGTVETPSPLDEARALRDKALKDCDSGAWLECLDGLNKAKALDPDGDRDPAIGAARAKAFDALTSPPPPDSAKDQKSSPPPPDSAKDQKSSPAPSSSAAPPPSPKAPVTAVPKPPAPKPTGGLKEGLNVDKAKPKKASKAGNFDLGEKK